MYSHMNVININQWNEGRDLKIKTDTHCGDACLYLHQCIKDCGFESVKALWTSK